MMAGELPSRFPGGEKKHARDPHFISGRLLEALRGVKKKTSAGELVDEGAYLWGVEDRLEGEGILRHVLLASRVAYALANQLREAGAGAYRDIDLRLVVEATLLHDIAKLYGEERERLDAESKKKLGLPPDFREISPAVDRAAELWLTRLGFPLEVRQAIQEHDFPEK